MGARYPLLAHFHLDIHIYRHIQPISNLPRQICELFIVRISFDLIGERVIPKYSVVGL